MRKINHFKAKGGQLVSIRDSITGATSKSTWSGETQRFWVKAPLVAAEIFGERTVYPGEPEAVFLLDDNEPDPAPAEGWCYAKGFFG